MCTLLPEGTDIYIQQHNHRKDLNPCLPLYYYGKFILFLLKNEISKQLADLFNFSFMTGVFPSILKIAKVVPVFKKD